MWELALTMEGQNIWSPPLPQKTLVWPAIYLYIYIYSYIYIYIYIYIYSYIHHIAFVYITFTLRVHTSIYGTRARISSHKLSGMGHGRRDSEQTYV